MQLENDEKIYFNTTITELVELEENGQNIFECIALPLNEESKPNMQGNKYMFTSPPENLEETFNITDEHDSKKIIGKTIAPLQVTEKGLLARFKLFATTDGKNAIELIREKVKTGLSVVAFNMQGNPDTKGVYRVHRYNLLEIGLVTNPAFTNASNILKASTEEINKPTNEKENKMTNTTIVEKPVEELPETEKFSMKQIAEEVSKMLTTQELPEGLAKFTSVQHLLESFMDASPAEQAEINNLFATAQFSEKDENYTNSEVMGRNIQPIIIKEIQTILDDARPLVSHCGSVPLGPGNKYEWEVFDSNIDDIIKQQAKEGDKLSMFKLDTQTKSSTVKTAGVLTEDSWQSVRATNPNYLKTRVRILLTCWARYTEKVFTQSLVNSSTAGETLANLEDVKALKKAILKAAVAVRKATGKKADLIAVSEELFIELGALDILPNPKYGTNNAIGTSDPSELAIDLGGFKVVESPFLTAKTMLILNGSVGELPETGLKFKAQDDVTTLSTTEAAYGMCAPGGIKFPKGVIKITVS